jgi:hypothetical protein
MIYIKNILLVSKALHENVLSFALRGVARAGSDAQARFGSFV